MSQPPKDQVFYHPSRLQLQAGLSCEDPNCSGRYVPKQRDLTLRRKNGVITICDSEYWECETCGEFVTAQEEIEKIRQEIHRQTGHSAQLTVHLEPALHRKLTEAAQANHRTLNHEIAVRLEQSLRVNG